jgi:hypothetical protein
VLRELFSGGAGVNALTPPLSRGERE